MKLLKKVLPVKEIYTELSKKDIIERLCSIRITNYDNQQIAIHSYMKVYDDRIQIKREPSLYESFRGAGEVSFKLHPLESGTKIIYDVQPCSKSTIIKGITSIALFLLVLAFYIFYLFGIQIISVTSILAAWALVIFILYYGLNNHIFQLRAYAQQLLRGVTDDHNVIEKK